MNPLHLYGWGIKIRVGNIEERSELWVKDGRQDNNEIKTYTFPPRQMPYDSIVVEGHSGYISMQALHWLARNNIPLFVMNYNGAVISQILPSIPIKADLRIAQIDASRDPKRKLSIAKALIEAKIARTLQVLDWLAERYDITREVQVTKHESMKLPKASAVTQLRTVEGRTARRYWEAYRKCMPEPLRFQGRMVKTKAMNAVDPVNLALNYGYGFLKCECRMAVNSVGLEPAIGFLHETSARQTRESLVYDLMEPFRFLVDLAVIQSFENGRLDTSSFYFAEQDYSYHFQLDAKGRFLDALREEFHSRVPYKEKPMRWDMVIREKAAQLGRYLAKVSNELDLCEPCPLLERDDNREVRETILSLTQSEARELGIGKSTLHYLRKRATSNRPFEVYARMNSALDKGKALTRMKSQAS
jgi:CRISPR-associated protein Cas1